MAEQSNRDNSIVGYDTEEGKLDTCTSLQIWLGKDVQTSSEEIEQNNKEKSSRKANKRKRLSNSQSVKESVKERTINDYLNATLGLKAHRSQCSVSHNKLNNW